MELDAFTRGNPNDRCVGIVPAEMTLVLVDRVSMCATSSHGGSLREIGVSSEVPDGRKSINRNDRKSKDGRIAN